MKSHLTEHRHRFVIGMALSFVLTLPCSSASAQASDPTTECSVIPTEASPQTSVILDSVGFEPQSELSEELRDQILAAVKQQNYFSADSDDDIQTIELWFLGELKQAISFRLQEDGHFKAVANVTAGLNRAEPHRLHYWISVDAQPGPQYTLGQMRFVKDVKDGCNDRRQCRVEGSEVTYRQTTVINEPILREQIALKSGEIFNTSKIRDGIDQIRHLYSKLGYIDATTEPQFTIHDESNVIDVRFVMDEEAQYRIESVEVRGLDQSTRDVLQSSLQPGLMFDLSVLDGLGAVHRELQPYGVAILRDTAHATIKIVIDPHACPAFSPTAP